MTFLSSRSDDALLANPLGPPLRGGRTVAEAGERIKTDFSDGTCEFEEMARYAMPDLGYLKRR